MLIPILLSEYCQRKKTDRNLNTEKTGNKCNIRSAKDYGRQFIWRKLFFGHYFVFIAISGFTHLHKQFIHFNQYKFRFALNALCIPTVFFTAATYLTSFVSLTEIFPRWKFQLKCTFVYFFFATNINNPMKLQFRFLLPCKQTFIFQLCIQTNLMTGNVSMCGVKKGGNAIGKANRLSHKKLFLQSWKVGNFRQMKKSNEIQSLMA